MAVGDSYVQVAPDSTGKRLDTSLVRTLQADVTTGIPIDVYRQRVELVGVSQDSLDQLLAQARLHTALLRAILANLNAVSNLSLSEEDFPPE